MTSLSSQSTCGDERRQTSLIGRHPRGGGDSSPAYSGCVGSNWREMGHFWAWRKGNGVPLGGGGHCLFGGRGPKQNYRPPVLCYHSPLSLPLLIYSPLFSRYQRTAYCYYCCYHGLPSMDIIFSCPDTITLITAAKTLITANPGCFPETSQANNYSPNRKCPSDSPPSESSWACDSPLFSSLQPQLRESVLQWVPKTRVSAPLPPPGVPPYMGIFFRGFTPVWMCF